MQSWRLLWPSLSGRWGSISSRAGHCSTVSTRHSDSHYGRLWRPGARDSHRPGFRHHLHVRRQLASCSTRSLSTVQSIVQSELLATFGQRRRFRKMSKLRNHYIICGAGRVGSRLVRTLQAGEEDFHGHRKRSAKSCRVGGSGGVIVLARDATSEDALKRLVLNMRAAWRRVCLTMLTMFTLC